MNTDRGSNQEAICGGLDLLVQENRPEPSKEHVAGFSVQEDADDLRFRGMRLVYDESFQVYDDDLHGGAR